MQKNGHEHKTFVQSRAQLIDIIMSVRFTSKVSEALCNQVFALNDQVRQIERKIIQTCVRSGMRRADLHDLLKHHITDPKLVDMLVAQSNNRVGEEIKRSNLC